MIPTPADLRLLRRFDRTNDWELAVHGAGHLVIAATHRGAPDGLLRLGRHLDPVAHVRSITEASAAGVHDRAVFLFAGYAANEVARDEYRSAADLTFAVHPDDHDGAHLLEAVEHLPDTSAERFLLTAAAEAAELVRDRWAAVATLAAELHAEGRAARLEAEAGRSVSA